MRVRALVRTVFLKPVELGVVIGRKGCDIAATQAMDHVGGYGMAES